MDGKLGDKNPENLERVIAYQVRIYFLPPPVAQPNQWVKEFNQYVKLAKQSLDPNTAAWRIFCVVTEIQFAATSSNAIKYYLYNAAEPVLMNCS